VVEFASNIAEGIPPGSTIAPTITFPLLVIEPVVKLAIVPTVAKFGNDVNVVLLVAVIFPAVAAFVAVAAFPVVF
jgi:hypothetical protein